MKSSISLGLRRLATALVVALLTAGGASSSAAQTRAIAQPRTPAPVRPIEGAWAAETYHLRDGASHALQGRIFFAESDWQVLFFVMDDDGEPRRGSAEGGGYTLDGDRLVFTHLFNLSVGEAMDGLPAAELRMVARGPADAPEEPTRVDVSGERLVLHFPSGNRMVFGRR